MMPDQALAAAVADGKLEADPAQMAVATHLTRLCTEIADWQGGLGGKLGGPLGRFLRDRKPVPTGVYLWGGVGTGKSLLMDMFYRGCTVGARRRVHFLAFMQEVHARLAEERKNVGRDPLPRVAAALARDTRVLCFDEFQVTNVADAMILGRLFEGLFANGVVVVATSNRAPEDLYRNGLNRQLFEPFIGLLRQTLQVLQLDSGRDYRLEKLQAAPVYYTPLDAAADAAMNAAFERLTMGAEPRSCVLTVQGRRLEVAREAAGVARFGFDELCDRPLGPADYQRIAETFDTLLIEHVPQLTPDRRDVAARFVTLIDTLYEVKTKLVISAAVSPDALYPDGDGAFEFQRTASRLMEMRSHDYLSAARQAVDTGDS